MRTIAALVLLWMLIGGLAAYQRDYLTDRDSSCAETGTTVVTVLAGPLNYIGVNPKVGDCNVPEPSK